RGISWGGEDRVVFVCDFRTSQHRTLLEGQQQDLMYRPWAVIVVQPNNER
ncbi:unnamed protein product, partial [Fusarium graminearum]